jgi:hypothetical protein
MYLHENQSVKWLESQTRKKSSICVGSLSSEKKRKSVPLFFALRFIENSLLFQTLLFIFVHLSNFKPCIRQRRGPFRLLAHLHLSKTHINRAVSRKIQVSRAQDIGYILIGAPIVIDASGRERRGRMKEDKHTCLPIVIKRYREAQ